MYQFQLVAALLLCVLIYRICGKISEGTFEKSSPQQGAFVHTNMVKSSPFNKVEIAWQSEPNETTGTTRTTSKTTTEQPPGKQSQF